MNPIASSIPGRLRLRAPGLRNPARLESLHAAIAKWSGVLAVETNPKAGSLLVRYDVRHLERTRIEARAATAAAKVLGTHATKVGAGGTAADARHHGGTPRVKANRWAKRGMLASLTVSLLLAAAGTKRWHALAGVAFMHALAVHLWAHRRHILR
jgi:hypothetical protein